MYKIDIFSVDNPFLSKLEKPLVQNLELDEFKNDTIVVSRQHCLLCQVLRLLNTYNDINISRQAKLLLDIAKDVQRYEESFRDHENTNKVIFNFGSTIMDYYYDLQAQIKRLDKVSLKAIFRRLVRKPDFVIYLDFNYNTILARKRKGPRRYKVEISLKGKGLLTKQARMPKVLNTVKEKFGIEYAIINCEGLDLDQISQGIIKVSKEFYERKKNSS